MPIELKIPAIGESITEVEIGDWLKRKGESVQKDEPLVTLESEKATVELPAPAGGTVTEVLKKKGDTAKIGEIIAYIEDGARPAAAASNDVTKTASEAGHAPTIMPAAAHALAENKIRPDEVQPSGPGGRLLKEDVLRQVKQPKPKDEAAAPAKPAAISSDGRQEEIVPMTRLRRTVAERLVQVQQAAALLTTFNEVDMSAVMALRAEFGEGFLKKHNVKLGFMSFFIKATVEALKQVPVVNAELRETNIVYHNYYDISVAIGGGKGLVVPVLRNAERLSFAEIEITIGELAKRAKENKLKPDELQGGTFTISNGGVYGSLMSTPIINPPQSGILGMHAIQERPVARDANVVIRPMMYLALTYDHRIVDGREAVTFLRHIKEFVESPARMLLEV
jgi:2-oxoglutarate dehydrogenase E2 component (dihydrolipoamide succinyltransferase)